MFFVCLFFLRQIGKQEGPQNKYRPGPKGAKGRPAKAVAAPTGNAHVARLRIKACQLQVALATGTGRGAPYDPGGCLMAVRVITHTFLSS